MGTTNSLNNIPPPIDIKKVESEIFMLNPFRLNICPAMDRGKSPVTLSCTQRERRRRWRKQKEGEHV